MTEIVSASPQTTPENRQTVLRAERRDTVVINGWFETTVVKRTETYYGPELRLAAERRNYLLYAPGFDRQLLLWEAETNERGYIEGWRKIGGVDARIDTVEQYDICPQCGSPIRSAEHERLAAIGRCPKGSKVPE